MSKMNDRYWIDFMMGLLADGRTRHKTEIILEEIHRRDLFDHIQIDSVSRVQIASTMQKVIRDARMSNANRCYAVQLFVKFSNVDPLIFFGEYIGTECWLVDVSEAFVAIAMMESMAPRAQSGDQAAIDFIKNIQENTSSFAKLQIGR